MSSRLLQLRREVHDHSLEGDFVYIRPVPECPTLVSNLRVAIEAAIDKAEEWGVGKRRVNFRLRDWGISRQRYWGCPIPVIHCEACGIVPVPQSDLPVRLPDDVEFDRPGNPLDRHPTWKQVPCPACGKLARRETDTMDTFVDSSWYFFRYCDPRNDHAPFDPAIVNAWFPIDLYVGGITHATMHLIYCRFFAKVLRDLGLLKFGEPVQNLLCQGMVLKGGTAMSKSKGNIVDPDDMVRRYGADTTRLFTLFAAPPEKDLEWNEMGVEGCFRFLERVWRLLAPRAADLARAPLPADGDGAGDPRRARLRRRVHRTIERVTVDIERRLHLNTPVAALMELLNEIQDFSREITKDDLPCLKEAGLTMALLLQPFAPHISEEFWESLGGRGTAVRQAWPSASERWLKEDEVEIPVQVNGRLRGRLLIPSSLPETEVVARARQDVNVASHLEGRTIRKTIYLQGRLLNIVVG